MFIKMSVQRATATSENRQRTVRERGTIQHMPGTIVDLLATIVGSTVLTSAAIYGIVKFLLKPVWTALNGYATTYASGQASIDVRIRNLEKLAEEQARLTRTVESIKDEIAAQAKSRDDRWAFRKDVYVGLINAATDLITAFSRLQVLAERDPTDDRVGECYNGLMSSVAEFVRQANLAQLATADPVPSLASVAAVELMTIHGDTQDESERIAALIERLYLLRASLQEAGRKDLWGPGPETRPVAAKPT